MNRLCKVAVPAATEARALISELRQLDERCGTIIGHCKELIDAGTKQLAAGKMTRPNLGFPFRVSDGRKRP